VPLRGPRFSKDPVLEECFAGHHRMFAGEDGLPVRRVQAALIELGFPVGALGDDGKFGPDTGAAVTAYKTARGLSPNDPVVGAGTSKSLDDDLFVDPPELDPAFGEFAPFSVQHQMEPFVAFELIAMLRAPLDSWRHMMGNFTLTSLNSGLLLGIAAQSRAIDLRDAFLAAANPIQPDGNTAEDEFDQDIVPDPVQAVTITFRAGNDDRAFMLIADEVILGRARIFRVNGQSAPSTLIGTLMHELSHVRNLAGSDFLSLADDSDTDAFADTQLAAMRSAAGPRTAEVMRTWVEEMVARHLEWIVLQELNGTPGTIAVMGVQPAELAAAANFYFVEVPGTYDFNDYGKLLTAEGNELRFQQIALWLRKCATFVFSDDSDADQQSTLLFQAAADFIEALTDASPPLPPPNGVFPLLADFH
jgi:peptidoglycan hydrolase-like protein with peptidoglycan-binding domain